MPPHAYISDLKDHIGKEVQLKGWLYNRRGKGKILFLLVRDGTGIIQCVGVKKEVGDELFDRCKQVPQESSIIVTGDPGERSPADARSDDEGAERGDRDQQAAVEEGEGLRGEAGGVDRQGGHVQERRECRAALHAFSLPAGGQTETVVV